LDFRIQAPRVSSAIEQWAIEQWNDGNAIDVGEPCARRFAPRGRRSRCRRAFHRMTVAGAPLHRHSPFRRSSHEFLSDFFNFQRGSIMLMQIILHTPKWVFAIFFLLLWLGARQLIAHDLSLNLVTLMPVAMGALSVYGVVSIFGVSPAALGGWTAAALAMLALVLRRPLPAATRYDAAQRRFHVAGSPVPLALMMGIFLTKYAVGIALAMHPELRRQAAFGLALSVLYGAFSGVFVARTVRLW
jgi:hypothetical protein